MGNGGGVLAAAKAGELVRGDELDDEKEAEDEISGPFFCRDLPFLAEVDNGSLGGEAHADLDIFHQGLGGKTAGGAEGGAAKEHDLIAERNSAEDHAQFVEGLYQESAWVG